MSWNRKKNINMKLPSEYKISVIVTARNYGKYLKQCLDSVLSQCFKDYELVVINDGSEDQTAIILDDYLKRYSHKMRVITLDKEGLAKACNTGIKASKGKYVIRLDADDYFDDNILLVESNILDTDSNIQMVYPDYYRINNEGDILNLCRMPKVNKEIKLLDRNPLAAGAMFRRECYDAIGGYNETLKYQEDYDFWIRFTDKFNVYNVNLPLMYYRQHDKNMSNNFRERMKTRQAVKKKFLEKKGICPSKNITAVIPAMGKSRSIEKLALRDLCGKPLIAYTITEALRSEYVNRIIVSTDDPEIAEVSRKYGAEVPFLRPKKLATIGVKVEDILRDLIKRLPPGQDNVSNILAILYYITPLRKACHIDEAINSMLMFQTDSVISVVKDLTFHWKTGEYGLSPVGYHQRFLREEKEINYKETGAVYIVKKLVVENGGYLGRAIGHIEMSPEESWRVEDELSLNIAEHILINNSE